MAPFPAPKYSRKSGYIIENICKYMNANRNEPRAINNTKNPLCQCHQQIEHKNQLCLLLLSLIHSSIPPPLRQPHIMTEKKRRRRCEFRGVGRLPSPVPSPTLPLSEEQKQCFIYDKTHTRDAMHKKVSPSGHIYAHTNTHTYKREIKI